MKIEKHRIRIEIRGAVQGVGFRPFVFNLARELNLCGWVINSSGGVVVEVEGEHRGINTFVDRLKSEKPALAVIYSFQCIYLDAVGFQNFEIRESDSSEEKTTIILPDIATCPQCLEEIFNSSDRRYLYPFTNCTHCGPRYSIIEKLPYDRENTSMRSFKLCSDCRDEYLDPVDRRFHAQPNACPLCGPHLELYNAAGKILQTHSRALNDSVKLIDDGKIIAVKGLGGFHLMVDAGNKKSVEYLRKKKHREEKPFALMLATIKAAQEICEVTSTERQLLLSNESPIVLLKKKNSCNIAESIAPDNPYLGIMLPYTPLHHILLHKLGRPVVATSGNLSDEPICIDNDETVKRLHGIADAFLMHNRPIIRHVDDSIVRIIMGRPLILRRARGYAPLPVHINEEISPILAVGGHLKNTIALSVKNNIFISQHIGDLETKHSFETFKKTINSMQSLYETKPAQVVSDKHPDYLSTQYAHKLSHKALKVQHHHAHIAACMAENHLDGTVLGIAWDGTGYGEDKTVWGGEFLLSSFKENKRIGHFRDFPLPGGDLAVKEPRRTALGLLIEICGKKLSSQNDLPSLRAFTTEEIKVLFAMAQKQINSPRTTSAGRLFDAAASILGLRQIARFEGQAAIHLEFEIKDQSTDEIYPFIFNADKANRFIVDWEPMFIELIKDRNSKVGIDKIAVKFHNTMVETIVTAASRTDEKRVVLSGGCFQNKYLIEKTITRLREKGFTPYWHQIVPPNDGGIALGQAIVGSRLLSGR